MAIGWLTALKVIPWGDVIEAAPGIAKGARKFFNRTQGADMEAPPPPVDLPAGDAAPASAAIDTARLRQLEAQVAQLQEQQQASAGLIESLAEHNAKVVQAIDILRVRTRMLLIVSGGLTVTTLGLLVWVVR
jgi:hypothetical protein